MNCDQMPAEPKAPGSHQLKSLNGDQMKKYEDQLKRQRPVLVGHNQFHDLCFLYEKFIGDLPSSLGDFKDQIRHLFPRLVDTKYLGSKGEHSMIADETLTNSKPITTYRSPALLSFEKGREISQNLNPDFTESC
jgi:hypothetical protein